MKDCVAMNMSLEDCSSEALHLHGLLDGLDAMQNEGNAETWGEAIAATTIVARRMSRQLADALSTLQDQERRAEH